MQAILKLLLAMFALAWLEPALAECYRPKSALPRVAREAIPDLARTRCANTATGWRIETLLKANPEKEADTEAQAARFLLRRAVVAACDSPMPEDTMGMSEVECVPFPHRLYATPLHQAPTTEVIDAEGEDDYWCQSVVAGLVFENTVRFNRRLVQHPAYPNKDLCRIVEKLGRPSSLLYGIAPRPDQVPAAIPDLPTAARFGQVDKVQAFLDAGADPGQVDALKLTALEWAVLRDYRAVFDRLADLPSSQRYCAAASTAIRYQRPEMAAKLAGRCNEPELLSGLASAAAEAGYLDAVRALVERGLDLNDPGGKDWGAPLQHAALGGHPDVVQYLLDRGANANWARYSAPNDIAKLVTPLYHAIINKRKNPDVVRILLDRGAPINNCYEWHEGRGGDMPALLWALSYGTPEIVKVLVGHGAPVDGPVNPEQVYKCAADRWRQQQKTRRNLDPPIFSVLSDNSKGMLDVLLKLGAKPNIRDSDGATPLIAAIVTNPIADHHGLKLVRVLLAQKADPNLRSASGLAPLHHAAKLDQWRDVVDLLLEAGADINIRDNDGRTPLDYATDLQRDYMAGRLRQKGARSGKN